MVIKNKNSVSLKNPTICLTKLDPNLYALDKNLPVLLPNISHNASSKKKIKNEIECMFTSEVDMNEAEQYNFTPERLINCTCGNCSLYYEYKDDLREQILHSMLEENFNFDPSFNQNGRIDSSANKYFSVFSQNSPVITVSTAVQTDSIMYKYKCNECGSKFNNEYYYEHHRLIHYRALMECPFCNSVHTNKKLFQRHVLQHMNKNYFECIYCGVAYHEKKCLIRHLIVHKKDFFRCAKCSAQFETSKLLNEHEKCHKSSGQLIHIFRKKKDTNWFHNEVPATQIVETIDIPRTRSHTNKLFYECEKCNLKFYNCKSRNSHFVIHNRTNMKMYPWKCLYCNARFKKNVFRSLHQRAAHK
ncbi:hypothetical protein PGB90_008948 [Kerria lacca]